MEVKHKSNKQFQPPDDMASTLSGIPSCSSGLGCNVVAVAFVGNDGEIMIQAS